MEIEGYNRDDCVSTLRLRNWLEDQRAELVRDSAIFPVPPCPSRRSGKTARHRRP